jgi:catechol 2,3-dioxygenase-like lactoylglutathione lyase family enzyme
VAIVDHVNLPVTDLLRSRAFYERVLGALGYRLVGEDGDAVGFGVDHWAFGIVLASPPVRPLHVAFVAPSREHVRRFFNAALAAGGRANGEPGPRTHYDPAYFAAFVLDPDGHNVEAVHRG